MAGCVLGSGGLHISAAMAVTESLIEAVFAACQKNGCLPGWIYARMIG